MVSDGEYLIAVAIRQEGVHAGALVRYSVTTFLLISLRKTTVCKMPMQLELLDIYSLLCCSIVCQIRFLMGN